MKKKDKTTFKVITEILALIGAILLSIYGVTYILGISLAISWMLHGKMMLFGLGGKIAGIMLILIGIIIFVGFDIIKISLKTNMNWTFLLVLGFISWIFGGGLGSILLFLAAIIGFISII